MTAPAPQCQPSNADLVERLRREGADAFNQKYSLGMFKLCAEAADRIEELEAATSQSCCEITSLKRQAERAHEAWLAAERRIEELEIALDKIVAMDPKGIRADDLGRAVRIAAEVIHGVARGSGES